MHSLFNFSNPQIQSLLWVQVIGMPIAFLVRATVLLVRAFREPIENRKKHLIRAVSNVLFAVSCWVFSFSHVDAAICFASGIALSIWAFTIAREQAIRNAPPRAARPKLPAPPISIRNSRLARLRRQ
jgi:hypothetical protein